MQNQPNPDDRLAQKGTVSRSISQGSDGRSLATRPGIKHRPNVARNGCAEQSNPFDVLQQWSRQPTASPNGRDCPRLVLSLSKQANAFGKAEGYADVGRVYGKSSATEGCRVLWQASLTY